MNKIVLFLLFIPLYCTAQQKQLWIKLPKAQWPTIALTNHFQFKNGDRYIDPSYTYGATGFLIDTGKDTLAIASKHTLWLIKSRPRTVKINSDLQYWIMKPKGNTTDSVIIDRLLNEDSTEVLQGPESSILERDWLIFSVKTASRNIHPLIPRYTAPAPGEKVYILSCDYKNPACMIYEGKILKKLGMDILVERNMEESLPGSSGSPVIDSNGYLIGIMSSASADGETGKNVSVVISTEYLSNVLHNKPGLNTPKKDYGQLILNTVLQHGVTQAIEQYKQLTSDPQNYYTYNLRSANRNGLRETGEKLMEMNRIKEAIEILEFNIKVNPGFQGDLDLLNKAYQLRKN